MTMVTLTMCKAADYGLHTNLLRADSAAIKYLGWYADHAKLWQELVATTPTRWVFNINNHATPIGFIDLDMAGQPTTADFGIYVHAPHRGHGYGAAGLASLQTSLLGGKQVNALQPITPHRLRTHVANDNIPSLATLARCGFSIQRVTASEYLCTWTAKSKKTK